MAEYDITWKSPGLNSQGSIPLGNGDIGINAWIEANGDLLFYVSKTDAWSENGQLLKLGLVRVSITPAPNLSTSFSQRLVLENGELRVQMNKVKIRLWVDANHPVVQVDVSSEKPVHATVILNSWRKKRYEITGAETGAVYGVGDLLPDKRFRQPVFMEPDSILPAMSDRIWMCHFNQYSHWKANLALQSLSDFASAASDPLLHRSFGLAAEGKDFTSQSDTSLVTQKAVKRLQLQIHAATNMGSIEQWKEVVNANVEKVRQQDQAKRQSAHQQWWRQFWNQHYIYVSSTDTAEQQQAKAVTQGYILQRYMNACGGRGKAPIKFNGSIFTVDTYNRKGANAGLNADFRAWGAPYWWQNTRLPYWSMLQSGDFQLMAPMFSMYLNTLELRKAATKRYYNHEGAFFPETMNFWGTYTSGNFGTNREGLAAGFVVNPYIRYYWQSGLELSLMMLDYFAFTQSESFAKDTLVPFVSQVLLFYDQHYKRDMQGQLMITPSMSLETYHTAVNPAPELAGLRVVTEKMLALRDQLISEKDRKTFQQLLQSIPPLPTRVAHGDTLLAPALLYGDKQNAENPELYSVFPYRMHTVSAGNRAMGLKTFSARLHPENKGWQTNSIQAACLGLTQVAKQMVVESFTTHDRNFRFPAFWGPNYDWTPDQDHGSVAMIALQRMLMQYEDSTVNVLPAWPAEWDVHFKVAGPDATTIEGRYYNGKMLDLTISPVNRIKLIRNY